MQTNILRLRIPAQKKVEKPYINTTLQSGVEMSSDKVDFLHVLPVAAQGNYMKINMKMSSLPFEQGQQPF